MKPPRRAVKKHRGTVNQVEESLGQGVLYKSSTSGQKNFTSTGNRRIASQHRSMALCNT